MLQRLTRGMSAGALLLPVLSTTTVAQTENEDTAPAGAQSLAPISVTATRTPISAFEYPGAVSVIGAEAIRDRQPSTPGDVLGDIPNVEFTGGPRRTGEVPSIRGLSGADIVVTIDGARQNFLSGHDGRFFVDPALLREAEVLRGPGSSLYGSGATGGVIALRTIRAEDLLAPGERAGVRMRGGYQTVNDEAQAGVTAYGRPAHDLGVLASIQSRKSGDIELGNGDELSSSDDILSGLFKARWQPGEHGELEASWQRFDNQAREPNNAQDAGSDDSVDKDIRADTAWLAYSYNDPANPWVDLDVLVYRDNTTLDELRLDDNGDGPRGELLERSLETSGLRLDNRSRMSFGESDVTFTYGVEGYRDEQRGADDSGTRPGVPDADQDFEAAYAQVLVRWPEPLALPGEVLLLPGVRFDRFESSSDRGEDLADDAISPRLGLTYKPTPSTMVFVNRADAFRAPTLNEIYPSGVHFVIPGVGINRFAPNADLEPQTTETLEFGGGVDLYDVLASGDRLNVKYTHFEINGEDFIDSQVRQPTPPQCFPPNCNGMTRSVNVADAELWGDEIEAAYQAGPLELLLGFSRIDGEDQDTGEKLGVLTPPQYTLGARYDLPALDSTVGGRLLYAGEFDEVNDPAEERDAYTVVDLFYTWQPRQGSLRGLIVRAGIDNVFDEAYSRTFTGAVEAGRSFNLAIEYNL